MEYKSGNEIIAETVFDHNYYWATKEQIENSDLYIIDKTGIELLKEKYKGTRVSVVIYIDVDGETCLERMKKRGDKSEAIFDRLNNDSKEFVSIEKLADFIVNGDNIDTWQTVANIIEKCEGVDLSVY